MPRTKFATRLALAALSVLILAGCSSEVADTHPEQPVTKRREAFKAILRSFEPMGTMLKDKRYDADAFARLADEFGRLRDAPWSHFGADTNYPPTKAKPAVWEKPAEFDQRRQAFATASERLLAAAAERNEAAVRTAYAAAQDSCKACHRDFRK
ncbi:Cytochrome c' [Thauera sp. GDN1]|uniref:c-type cytochrome n=1 Tax=Thauera sp. GDN1 TaxID=2944810 RepID=UPI002479138A|nr:cytochrome c [Thauera sp. GDN1]WEN42296.1 Cytochrome c' [Thauera sp. GDN1]